MGRNPLTLSNSPYYGIKNNMTDLQKAKTGAISLSLQATSKKLSLLHNKQVIRNFDVTCNHRYHACTYISWKCIIKKHGLWLITITPIYAKLIFVCQFLPTCINYSGIYPFTPDTIGITESVLNIEISLFQGLIYTHQYIRICGKTECPVFSPEFCKQRVQI